MSVFHLSFFLTDVVHKSWVIEIIAGAVTIGGALFIYLQAKSKNNADIQIAQSNNLGESTKQELANARKTLERNLADLKKLEAELDTERKKRRESEALRIENEKKLQDEITARDMTIMKLEQSVKAVKSMLRISLLQMERHFDGLPEKAELMGVFKEIHLHLDGDGGRY